jgi:hypothetical protein
MSELLCNGANVISGTIALPRIGMWSADLVVDSTTAIAGAVTIAPPDGTRPLVGTTVHSGLFEDRVEMRVVGGAGRMGFPVEPRYYRGVPLRLPLGDLLREAGERLSPSSSAQVLDTLLQKWTREGSSTGRALNHLTDAVGASWRVLQDGTLWVGTETWPSIEVVHDLISEHTSENRVEIATESIDAALVPGTVFLGRRVSYVEHRVAPDSMRTMVWFEASGSVTDRIKSVFEAFINQIMRRIDYLAGYRARVVSQAADGTLELQPDDTRLPGMTGVPIRYGVPGAKATITAGTYLWIQFEHGDPQRPVATHWESGSTTEVSLDSTAIKLGTAATRGIARQSDTVDQSAAMLTWMNAVSTATGAPPLVGTTIGTISSSSGRGTCD